MAESGPESGCYVYRPAADATSSEHEDGSLAGITPERLDVFNRVWEPTRRILEGVLASSDAGAVERICAWLSALFPRTLDRIPTGLVTTTTASSLFDKVSAQADQDILVIGVPAAQCGNLKSVLKCVVSAVASKATPETRRLLNYDLEALRLHLDGGERRYEKVLLYFGNGESLHGGVLSDLVDVLDSWRDRIPFVFVFETAVGVEIFQEKLTRKALGSLRGEAFSTASAVDVVEAIFRAAATNAEQRLWMGANPASMLVERQAEHMQSAQSFVMAIKYMYMIHFYRNPLSSMLDGDREVETGRDSVEAARNCKSFQAHLADLKKQKKTKELKAWTEDDAELLKLVNASIERGRESLLEISNAVQVLNSIHEIAPGGTNLSWSKLYVQAMSGQLADSPAMRSLLLTARSMTSDGMKLLLARLVSLGVPGFEALQAKLEATLASHTEAGTLRSEHDKAHETTRTTVVAKKISLSKQKATLSKGDAEYSAVVKEVSAKLTKYLKDRLVKPKALLFNEIFIFDLRAPLREAFAPRPRHALDRALTVPGAYLACECCEPDRRLLSGSQPATSILYQLYVESGATVNIADLWAAFDAIMPSPGGDEAMDEDVAIDDQKLALFYQALAELKYLGMVKSSRKKADHLVKTRFLGL